MDLELKSLELYALIIEYRLLNLNIHYGHFRFRSFPPFGYPYCILELWFRNHFYDRL